MKTPKYVIDAEKAHAAKLDELVSARDAVKSLEGELKEAINLLTEARIKADETMPHCTMVCRRAYSSKEDSCGSFVIQRKTPGGMLVVRRPGAHPNDSRKFKWSKHRGAYVEASKTSWAGDNYVLRDVPSEYLPA